jgi:dihydrofolate reductase
MTDAAERCGEASRDFCRCCAARSCDYVCIHFRLRGAIHIEEGETLGRTVYWMNVSIDGFIEAAAGEHETEVHPWARIDERLYESFNQQLGDLALLIEGRVVYEMMEAAWPRAADDESLPGYMREFGRIWTTMPKAVVSRTRTSADHNTVVIGGGDAIEQLAAIRADTGGAIGVGGATLATALLRAGLLDELLLYVHPAILGSGRPLFDELAGPLLCDLMESTDFPNGVGLRRYSIRGGR